MVEFKIALMNALVVYGVPIVAGLLVLISGIALRYGLKLINKFLKLSFLESLDDRIRVSTLALKETIVKDFKEKANDGKLTDEELKDSLAKAKAALVAEIMKQFGTDLNWTKDLIGDPGKYLEDKIEEWVFAHKLITDSKVAGSILNPPVNNAAGNPSPVAPK
jgi:hypothetical protein